MNRETPNSRRASAAQPIVGATIPRPPPPPLVAPRPLQRARDVAYAAGRFIGYSRPPSPQSEAGPDRIVQRSALYSRRTPLGMSQNASTSHKTGLPINTIAINELGTHALIAGKEIFKTVKVEDGRCTEDINLRTSILGAPKNASGAPRDTYQIDIADVAWAKGDHGDFVAAATSSGKIIIYNLEIAGLKPVQLHEHFRQVHKITFNPHKGNFLLSGSQDGTVRLWDIRAARDAASTLPSKRKYSGQADGVRDVKWSPTEGLDFAFGTDNGDIQRWDMRNLKMPKVKISGHLLACNAIDWHPDGKHLISASSDKTVRVFDMSSSRTKKASWEIKTPYPVMNARWRPSCESAILSDNGARLCMQVLTSYDPTHPVMHLYDLRRPLLPFIEFEPYVSATTDFLWHSQDLLWTVGREGNFMQTDIKTIPKHMERRNLQTTAFSSLGEVLVIAQPCKERQSTAFSRSTLLSKSSSALSIGSESLLSRSWADDSIDHMFLGVVPSRRRQDHPDNSSRSHTTTSSPVTGSYGHSSAPTIKLDEVLLHRKSMRPHQAALRGRLLGHNNPQTILALSMPLDMWSEMSSNHPQLAVLVGNALDRCVKLAASLGFHQLSQTWKIAQFCVVTHLEERQQLQQKLKAEKQTTKHRPLIGVPSIPLLASRLAFQYSKSPTQSPGSMRPVSSMMQHLGPPPESTSNLPTPLARATTTSKLAQELSLPDPADEALTLPPSLARSHPLDSASTDEQRKQTQSQLDQRLTTNNLTDLQRQHSHEEGTSDRIDMVRKWSVQRRVPLNLERVDLGDMALPPQLEKHDSNESFKFLEGSFESRSGGFPQSYSSVESAGQMVAERPSRSKNFSEVPDFRHHEHAVPIRNDSLPFEGSGILANSTDRDPSSTENSYGFPPPDSASHSGGAKQANPETSPLEDSEVQAPPERTLENIDTQVRHSEADSKDDVESDVPDTTARGISHGALAMDKFASIPDTPSQAVRNRDVEYVDIEDDKPWTLVEMLHKLIEFYTTEQPWPQTVSALLLLVAPLLPLTHPLQDHEIRQTIRVYLEYFIDHLALDAHEVDRWFAACDYEQPLLAGISPLQIENVLCTYHDQLLSQRLFTLAAELRQVAYPAYPSLYEDFVKDNAVHVKCGNCGKVILPSVTADTKCAKCQTRQNACSICCMPGSPWDTIASSPSPTSSPPSCSSPRNAGIQNPAARTRTACLACGHGGHVACYQQWFVEAAGVGCPSEGCLCACVSVGEIGAVV